MDEKPQQTTRTAYLASVKDNLTGRVYLTCPRNCGRAMIGKPDGQLIRWSCDCGYVIHS